jgi:hypothetical protein
MLFPEGKRSFITLKIKVCKEHRVVRHLPERIVVVRWGRVLGSATGTLARRARGCHGVCAQCGIRA